MNAIAKTMDPAFYRSLEHGTWNGCNNFVCHDFVKTGLASSGAFGNTHQKKIDGPFGHVDTIGDGFIETLAQREGLKIQRNISDGGLLNSINQLNLPGPT